MMDDLEGSEFRAAIERKFEIDLTGRPTMYTVRVSSATATVISIPTPRPRSSRFCSISTRDGKRMEAGSACYARASRWTIPSRKSSPNGGTLLAFRRSDNSWHGHKPFTGQRRAIQLNWVTGSDVVTSEQRRHAFATRIKKLRNMLLPMAG